MKKPKPAGEPLPGANEGKTLTIALQPICQEILFQQIECALAKARSVFSGLPEAEELWRLHSVLDLLEPLHTAAISTVILSDPESILAYVAALTTIYEGFRTRASVLEVRYASKLDP